MPCDVPVIDNVKHIKHRYKDAILFFGNGDCYEMCFDYARAGSRVLGVTLTSKRTGRMGKVPLAGIPVKAADGYIAKLVKSGHRVAICEQVEDPKKAKGLVKRDVLEVITPGTITDDNILDSKRNNYIGSVFSSSAGDWGFSYIDLSTGEFLVTEFSENELIDEILRISPSELVMPESWTGMEVIPERLCMLNSLRERTTEILTSTSPDWCYSFDDALTRLTERFETNSLDGFGCQNLTDGVLAAGGLLVYLERVQPEALRMIRTLKPYFLDTHMMLDAGTLRNLEVFESMRPDLKKATLIDILDITRTPMGGRLLRQWLLKQLRDVREVNARLDGVAELFEDSGKRTAVRNILKGMGDIERLSGKLVSRKALPRDLVALKGTLELIPDLGAAIGEVSSGLLDECTANLSGFPGEVEIIEQAIVDDPPLQIGASGVIRDGYNDELDELRALKRGGTQWIADLQEIERKRTGISTLKVGYNRVFGYYIEVTKRHLSRVPPGYIRKQTLTQGERFITEELKEMEMKILSAQEKLESLELQLFTDLRDALAVKIDDFKAASQAIALADLLSSFAEVSSENRYTRPTVTEASSIHIEQRGHPFLEKLIAEA